MKFLGFLIKTIVLAAVLAAGAVGTAYYCAMEQNRESKAFVDDALADITAQWNPETFFQYADAEAFPKAEGREAEVKQLFAILQTLGTLQNVDGAKGHATAILALAGEEGLTLMANYEVKTVFEKGEATIIMTTSKKTGQWKIVQFHVNSPALMVNQQQAPVVEAPVVDAVPAEPIEPETVE